MNSAVQLFILVWIFPAVCQADDDISVRCEDVTGTVDEEVTLTCSLKKSGCCIRLYKFLYPEIYNNPAICREEFPRDSCEQRIRFPYSFSSTTAIMGKFRFFVQTTCGQKTTEFTVNITETSKPEPVTEDPGKKETSKPGPVTEDPGKKGRNGKGPEEPVGGETSKQEKAESRGFKVAVIAAAVSCFIIVIMPIIYKMKQHLKQKRMFLDNKETENVI
ncbi:hypothetical protein R3I93_018255 [Phoxinus phoxinus]|uniref:Uncharacterized protein n=1 Tax=Phoxinus phoxinus TaxID=58324 RepID=A0AAN9CLU8_9TELE